MSKIKILHITQAYGGVQTYIMDIIKNTDKDFIYGIACGKSELLEIATRDSISAYKIDFVREPNLIKDIKTLFQIILCIIKFRPDIIHAHSAKGGFIGRLAAKILRRKVVFTPNAFSYLGFTGIRQKLYLKIEVFAKMFTDILLAVSNSEAFRAINEVGYKKGKVKVVPNSITVNIQRNEPRYVLKGNVGMIGRLTYQKNPMLFLQIAEEVGKIMSNVKFKLLGEGYLDHLKEDVYKYIEKKKLSNVNILSWGKKQNAEELLKEIDIMLLTSRYEGLPFTLLEAMSMGIPVVATNVDGNKDVIDDGINGFLVEENNVMAISNIILNLLSDESLRRKIGLAAQKKIKNNFNLIENIKKIEEVYYNLGNNNKSI